MVLASMKSSKDELAASISIPARAEYLFEQQKQSIAVRTDRLFAALFFLQWLGAMIWSCAATPLTWDGTRSAIHIHVWQSALMGALILSLPLHFIFKKPGTELTRQTVAIAQILFSALLIAASGGRIETHFHVFGSLAFLAFYRDWRVLLTASCVTAVDHILRGLYLPDTIYGVSYAEPWRWVEHAAWVVFCDIFLILSIRASLKDMHDTTMRQAELEASRNSIEQEVVARTSELKSSEQNLRDSEAKIRAIFETAADSIVTVSEDGSIETANQTCEQMFGHHFHQFFGKHISFLITRIADAECNEETWTKLRERGRGSSEALRIEGVGSSRARGDFPIEISLSYVDLKGRNLITAIIRDISERKEAEKRVSEFYSIVSHELRTPLTSIRGSLGLVEGGMTGELSEETTELVGIARESCDRLIRLINDILDLKKLETGKFEFHKLECIPAELLGMTVSSTQGMAKDRDVRLEVGWTTEQKIIADTERLNQVLVNLVSNAIKFSPKGGVVELSATAGEGMIRFAIRDQGKGIAENLQHKLFKKFQQVDSSDKREQEGTGLGLAICKAIVEQHGGSIGVESAEGQGATFWFKVPAGLSSSTFDEIPDSKQVIVIEKGNDLSGLLANHRLPEVCEITHAKSSEEAAVLISRQVPDMVIFNQSEPDETYFELQERLRVLNAKYGKPVVLIASDDTHIVLDWHKAPVHEEHLLNGVKRALDSGNCPVVLVVEDDYSTRRTVVHQLEAHGIKCVEAADGEAALKMVAAESPQLIVLDVGLPSMDGFQFVQHLKEKQAGMTPVLVYTGRDLTNDERKLLTIGFTKYLTKSKASQEDLLNAVDELLGRKQVAKSAGSEREKDS